LRVWTGEYNAVGRGYEGPVTDDEPAAKPKRRGRVSRSIYVKAKGADIMVPVIVLPVLYRMNALRSDSQDAQTYQFRQAVKFKIDHKILPGSVDLDKQFALSYLNRWHCVIAKANILNSVANVLNGSRTLAERTIDSPVKSSISQFQQEKRGAMQT